MPAFFSKIIRENMIKNLPQIVLLNI
ncbi:hypothetical protein CVH07_06940, partial [Escherichia coli]